MKREIGIAQPEYLIEDWPGKYEVFSWLEYVVTVPNPIFVVTTRKANGAPNANLQSWGLPIGESGSYSSLVALLDHSHTYANILREKEWCVNPDLGGPDRAEPIAGAGGAGAKHCT